MDIQQAYNVWSEQYDTNLNKTRDLEALALRTVLGNLSFDTCLEMGCGTGKNTQWLCTKAQQLTAVDFSEQMLAKAREKVNAANVQFLQADMTQRWTFVDKLYELVSFSLVLEHIEDLEPVFKEASKVLIPSGYMYIGELHPFKQYSGSKARFDTAEGQQILTCFSHHISEFMQVAKAYGLELVDMNEFFDEDDYSGIPRILTLLFRKG